MNALPEEFNHFFRDEPDTAYRDRSAVLFGYLDLRPSESVLDCGCGLGTHSAVIKKIFPKTRVFGLEFEPERVRLAALAVRSGKFLRGSIYALPFAPETFDKILCSEVLEHLDDDSDALSELHRVLKKSGTLAISVPYDKYPFLWDPVNKVRTWLGLRPLTQGLFSGAWTDHRRLYNGPVLEQKLEKAGFQVIKTEVSSRTCFPFAHLLIYRIGKLFSGDTGPAAMQIRFGANSLSSWSPLRWAVKIFQYFGGNLRSEESPAKGRYINLMINAKKV